MSMSSRKDYMITADEETELNRWLMESNIPSFQTMTLVPLLRNNVFKNVVMFLFGQRQ